MQQPLSIKFPYGISHFPTIVREGYYFVDKTPYLEWLERRGESFLIFLRPRRFGKSLFLSLLEHYYGAQYEKDFEELFGSYYIGQHPTPKKNSCWILKFDFSGINTTSQEDTQKGFLFKVRDSIEKFIHQYLTLSKTDKQFILGQTEPSIMLQTLFRAVSLQSHRPIYLLIDEYDHFTNELMAFDFAAFLSYVTRNGFVRKFYEIIKIGTGEGLVERLFITGVTPITLDSLTSGFNIGTNFSTEQALNELMGFTEEQVRAMLVQAGVVEEIEQTLSDLKQWYNGYLFNIYATERLYNADMVLYFLKHYQYYQKYPITMLDTNIASDYSKLRRLFSLQTPVENYQVLKTIIEEKEIVGELVEQFSFERPFEENDFLSLLFYLGFLTIKEFEGGIIQFKTPNYVIEKLYLDYFLALTKETEALPSNIYKVELAMREMAAKGNPLPFLQVVQNVLTHLSRRDYQRFDEKYVKVIMIALALQVKTYFVKSEREATDGYMDILFIKHQAFKINHQYLFELKYLKKEQAKKLKTVEQQAKIQVLDYVQKDEAIKTMEGLQTWTVVVVKDQVVAKRVG